VAVLIDTSVLVAIERGRLRLQDLIDPDQEYAISTVTVGELLHGVERAVGPRAQARSAYVEALVGVFKALPVAVPVARAYARA